MADPITAPAPAKQPYQDTSVPDWMTMIKGELDIAPVTTPPTPTPEPPKPAPEKPSDKPSEPAVTAPKEPVKPDAPKPEEPEKRWPRTAVEWDNYKKADKERLDNIARERDEIKAERDRVKQEIESLKKQGPSPELDALKKERDELSDRLRLVSVENHPKFKSYFENKTNAQLELAKRIAGNGKGDRIVELLKAPESPIRDQELEQALADLTTVQQSRIASVLNNLAEIESERHSEIAKARDSYERIQSEQQEAHKANQSKVQKTFTDIVQSFTDKEKGNPAYQKRDGDEAWNSSVEQRLEQAKTLLFGDAGQDRVMKAALDAVAYPVALAQLKEVVSENARLQAQIKELTAAQPKVEGAQTTLTGGTPPTPKPKGYDSDPMQAAVNWMKQIHAPQEGQ